MSYQITSTIIGLVIAGTILWLIRRDHLHSRHALWWLMVTFSIVILGIFPHIIEIARQFGVNYPPTLVFILAFGMILIKVLSIDLHQSKLERQMRRLIQRIAILETERRQQKNAFEQEITHLNQKKKFKTKELPRAYHQLKKLSTKRNAKIKTKKARNKNYLPPHANRGTSK